MTIANVLVGVSRKRGHYGGRGYIAGQSPGLVSSNALPAVRPVEIRLRDLSRKTIDVQYSASDGTYNFSDLDPNLRFDLVARDEPYLVYNDVIVGAVYPWTDSEMIVHGTSPEYFVTPYAQVFEITGGVLPYSINGSSTIPSGSTATLAGRLLTITASTDPGSDLIVVLDDSSSLSTTITIRSYLIADPYRPNVRAILHYDGTNGSTTITDVIRGHSWTTGGAAALDTSNKKFGTASINLHSDGWAIHPAHPDFAIGSADFTIEGWKYQTATGGNQCLCDTRQTGVGVGIYESTTSYGNFLAVFDNASLVGKTTIGFTLNQWQHWSVCRHGTTLYASIDGVVQSIGSDGRTYDSLPGMIFGENILLSGQPQLGLNDEQRVTVGVARYITNFTPPAAPFV